MSRSAGSSTCTWNCRQLRELLLCAGDGVGIAGQIHVAQRRIEIAVVALQVALQPRQVLGDDVGHILGVRVAAGPVVEQQPAAWQMPSSADAFVELDRSGRRPRNASRKCACARLSAISDGSIDSICKPTASAICINMVERSLVGDGQQCVLMPGVELLRVAGQGLAARAECQVAQAAFFQLGELAADFVRRAGDDAGHAELAAQRDADLAPASRSSVTSVRNASVSSWTPCSVCSEVASLRQRIERVTTLSVAVLSSRAS